MSRPTPPAPPNGLTWGPFVLLGLLTIATMGGPVVILLALRGGARPGWPPDRPVEWWAFGLCTGAVVVLMTVCLLVGLVRWRRTTAAPRSLGTPRGAGG